MVRKLDRSLCRLCRQELGQENVNVVREPHRDPSNVRYDCGRCGEYVVDSTFEWALAAVAGDVPDEPRTAREVFERFGDIHDRRHLLSGWTRQRQVEGEEAGYLDEETARAVIGNAPFGVVEKIDRLLLNLAEMSNEQPAKEHDLIVGQAYPLGYGRDGDEFRYQVRHLHRAGLIEDPNLTAGGDKGKAHVRLSVPGWERTREIRRSGKESDRAFVAMSFSDGMESVWADAIQPAIDEAGYHPIRVDKQEHVERIDDKIQVELNRSRFVVADFTEHKHGVYFEAGYALGRGIPVIWTCHQDDLEDAHFDTEHYNHIVWSDEDELRQKLVIRIRAVVQ